MVDRTLWQLDIGNIRTRCVSVEDGFAVQGRTDHGWTTVLAKGTDPTALLQSLVNSATVHNALAERARSVR